MAKNRQVLGVGAVLLTVLGGTAACSSSSSGEPSTGSGSAMVDATNASVCPTWTSTTDPLEAYSANLTKTGKSGIFTFVLMDVAPAPPALGTLTWTMKILDANGQPVPDATMPVPTTWMPQHMHSSTATPIAASNGDGTYTISNLYLYMPGVWQVTVEATAGGTTDSTVFTFCLGT
jgi:hypothetical protein